MSRRVNGLIEVYCNADGEPVVVRQRHSRAAKQYRALAQRLEREIGYAE